MSGKMGRQVGDLAGEFDINPRTIRYYERIGLLTASTRTEAGYRIYSDGDRDRLRFILKAKATGLTLGEIQKILSLREKGQAPCAQVLAFVKAKLEQLDSHLSALLELREELLGLQREGSDQTAGGCVCGLIEDHEPRHEAESLRIATEVLSHRPVRARAVRQ